VPGHGRTGFQKHVRQFSVVGAELRGGGGEEGEGDISAGNGGEGGGDIGRWKEEGVILGAIGIWRDIA